MNRSDQRLLASSSLAAIVAMFAMCITAAHAQVPALMHAAPKPLHPNPLPVRSCESLADVTLPNATIESAAPSPNNPDICHVVVFTEGKVRIWIAIPTSNWNGRFLGNGGRGYSGGSPADVDRGAELGFVSGSTDGGHAGNTPTFALDANGQLDWQAIRNFGYAAVHEMTVTGKALTKALYGVPPRYSYWNSCSTGGRQGLMEAQRYPRDYDGIVAGAPAINWPNLMMQSFWGSMLMKEASNPVAPCKLAAATAAAIAACDPSDGVVDGVIEDPGRCFYDPEPLIGATVGECGTFTESDVDIIRGIWEGPRREDGRRLWYGQARGADLIALSAPRGNPPQIRAFPFSDGWLKFWVTQNPLFDWNTITFADYQDYWDQSYKMFGHVIATDNADLSAFRKGGGKMIIWHGGADQLITHYGTTHYYKRVEQRMGGPKMVSKFARLFLAPGVQHCEGGPGPVPEGLLDAVVTWVEDGKAPATLTAIKRDQTGAVTRSRPLCQYPLVAKYKGTGSTDEAANFTCANRREE
jgi:hypothetical protein